MQQGEGRGRPRSVSEPRHEAGLPAQQQQQQTEKKKKSSRDSSVSSSGREVRCGCQYFQTDSLLPERVTLVGRPPSRTSNMAATMGDHEYEVINPPPPRVDVDPPSDEKKPEVDVAVAAPAPRKRVDSETSSLGSGDPNFVHIPLHDDADDAAKELQARMEERFFAATPETTASRTDCDVNTSQLDSSGLEDLPLQRGSRKKKSDDREAEARGLQQRIRSQAGRLRAKLRSMKMPERPKFNLPDRPKFNMPERPKFNLPERPKFNLPERPKFNLPERPKFKFPERPKFNMPQRPKISMPSMPSFSSNSKERPVKKTSSTRRPLRDRANPSTESNASSSRKTFFDFDFKTYPRIFDRSRRKGDYATSSPKSTPRSQTPPPSMESTKPTITSRKKGPVGSRWVHRFTDIKYVDDEDHRQVEDPDEAGYRRDRDSPDFRIIKLRDSTEEEKDDEEEIRRDKIRYENEVRDAVEELDRQRQERESVHTESTTAFRDKDYDYAVGLTLAETNAQRNVSIPDSNQEERSSGSSSDRHRAGVLEEIDSDEFFLRQKGISQEDVEVGKYLTSEIREAFRPPTNTLSQMDEKYFYDEEEQEEDADNLGNQYRGTPEREPVPPARTRSLKPRKRGNRAPPVVEEEHDGSSNFNTFPPARPKRNRRQQEEEEEAQRLQDEEPLEDEQEEVTPPPRPTPPYIPTESQDMSYEEQQDDEDVQLQRQRRMDDDDADADWQDEDAKPQFEVTPPLAPKRVRRSRHEVQKASSREYVPEGQRNGHYAEDDWKENVEPNIMAQEVVALRMEPDYTGGREPVSASVPVPVPPKRERRRTTSRGASTHSLAEGRTSRGADSLRQEDDQEENMIARDEREEQEMQLEQLRDETMAEESNRMEQEQKQEKERTEMQQRQQDIDLGEIGGYAIVEKIYPVKPPRPNRPKPPRPPAPTRRKRFNHFFSLPRKNNHAPPTRPLRNYSTLGPSRPSRRDRARKSESYVEIDGDLCPSASEESHREDLQSGDVIERMKGRPLPAPPRPPRKTREAQDEDGDAEVTEVTEVVEPTIPPPDTSEHALGALNDAVFYSTKEIIVPAAKEISTVTQSTKPEATVVNQEEIITSNEVTPSSSKPEEISPSQVVAETAVIEDREAFLVPDNLAVESEPFEEVTVATQTDPLPDDFCMEVEDEEPPEHADACTETVEFEPEVPIPVAKEESSPKTAVSEEPVNVRLEQVVQQAPEPVYIRPATPPPPPPPTIIERQVPVYIMPDKDTVIELRAERLQVSDLDIERLNVGELQAQKILVSDIDGVSMQVAELSSKSGRLVINGIELPVGFLQELYDSFPRPEPVAQTTPSVPQSEPVSQAPLTQSEPVYSQPPTQCEPQTISAPPQTPVSSYPSEPVPPSIPPPPLHIPMDPAYSYIPSAMRVRRSQIQDMDSEEELISFVPSSHRRRRHHVPKPMPRYSTDEEEESVSFQPRRHPQRGDPSVLELGRQLGHAVTATSMRAVRSLIQYTTTQLEGEDKRRELQTVLCILLILVAGLILMGFGTGKTFHHHHWDYLSPPQ